MKRFALLLSLLTLAAPALARAQGAITFAMQSLDCAHSPHFGSVQWCFDTTAHGLYYWSGSAFVATPNTGGGTFSDTVTIAPVSTSHDALDITMPASTTGNSIAVKNSANQTLFAVPGGADSSHNSSQVASLAAIPIDTTNDAFFANIPSTDTAGNCFVCQDNSITQAAISQKGELFSSPTDTATVEIVANAPSGTSVDLMDLKVNGANKATVSKDGAITGAVVVTTLGVGSSPAVLATFGTCNSAAEGRSATETNSTGACSAGATATSSGSTHCQIYCNGTNWLQTGL
jgi:hypothetical protein